MRDYPAAAAGSVLFMCLVRCLLLLQLGWLAHALGRPHAHTHTNTQACIRIHTHALTCTCKHARMPSLGSSLEYYCGWHQPNLEVLWSGRNLGAD